MENQIFLCRTFLATKCGVRRTNFGSQFLAQGLRPIELSLASLSHQNLSFEELLAIRSILTCVALAKRVSKGY